jgi:hypothetical protein
MSKRLCACGAGFLIGHWEIKLEGTRLYVKEESCHPDYDGEYTLDFYAPPEFNKGESF